MNDFQRGDFQIAPETKRCAGNNCVWDNLRQASAEMGRLKHVLKNSADVFPRALVGVQAQRTPTKIQRANIIEAEDVIRMAVRDEDCIEMFYFVLESLLPKIRRGVNDDCLAGVLD